MVSQAVNDVAVAAYGKWHGVTDPDEMQRQYSAMLPSLLDGFKTTTDTVGGVPCVWVENPAIVGDTVIAYLHGGGHFVGSAEGYAGLASRIAKTANARVCVIDTSLVPVGVFPRPFDEALSAVRALVSDRGMDPSRLAVVGDSAGGGLALAVVIALRDGGGPLPAALALMSPWSDLTHSGDSFVTLDGVDPLLTKAGADQSAATYLGGADPHDVRASPFFADLAGLPPTLIQVGSTEALLSDSLRLAEKARAADVEVELQVAYEMIHVYQMFVDDFPQAEASLADIGRFIAAHAAGEGA